MSIKNYIKNKKTTHFTVNNIEVFVKDDVPAGVSVKNVILSLSERIPKHLMRNVESVYVGQFSFLKDRDLQASYENSSIFVTNEQENETDMVDDVIHEVAHSIEELYTRYLYSDQKLATEFGRKRIQTFKLLKQAGYEVDRNLFLGLDYNKEMDEFLYTSVGYQALSTMTSNIFHSPYASTSLSEYFADGFEAFYVRDDIPKLKKISPELYKKVTGLLVEEE